MEKILFAMLAQSHLALGGGVGFRGCKWIPDRESNNSYLSLNEKGEITATWADPDNVVQALVLNIKRARRKFDEVYFFFLDDKGSYEGVTWRMLKIDMSFLRIVMHHDQFTMKEIIRRFVRISEDAQNGPEEPFKNLN